MDDTSRIRPIETRYAGYRFRSRLEARWAVFFDSMGFEWQYEPQGYVIDGRAYLPDFWISGYGWAEVKGDPRGVDWKLWASFADLVRGEVSEEDPEFEHDFILLGPIPGLPRGDVRGDGDWVWTSLTYGDFAFCASKPRNHLWVQPCTSGPEEYDPAGVRPGLTFDVTSVDEYRAAISARFEHGEHGR